MFIFYIAQACFFFNCFLESGFEKSFTAVLSIGIKNVGFRGKAGFVTW